MVKPKQNTTHTIPVAIETSRGTRSKRMRAKAIQMSAINARTSKKMESVISSNPDMTKQPKENPGKLE